MEGVIQAEIHQKARSQTARCLQLSVWLALVLTLPAIACGGTPSLVTAPPSPSASALPPPSTATPEPPQGISIGNYQTLAPLNHWDAANIMKITGIALAPDSKNVALITSRYKEQWWLELRQSQGGNLLWDVNLGEKAAYNAIAFSPDGSLIAVGLDHGRVQVFHTGDGSRMDTLTGHVYSVRTVVFSPDGKYVASGASDNTACVWQVSNGMARASYNIKTDVRDIAWSPDSRYLAVTSNHVAVFDVASSGESLSVYYDSAGETQDLGEVAFSPDGLFLVGEGEWYNVENGRWRYRIFLWDFPYNTSSPIRIPIDDAISDAIISRDNRLLLGLYKDKGKLLIFNIVNREILGTFDIGPILLMAYSPDISQFAVVSTKTTVTIWGIQP